MSILQTADYKCTSKKAQFSYDIFFCETLGQLPSPAFGACGDIFMCGNFQGSPSELSVFIHSGDGTWTEWSKQADFHHPIHSDVILAVSDKSRKDIPKDAKYWVWRGKQNSIMHYKRNTHLRDFRPRKRQAVGNPTAGPSNSADSAIARVPSISSDAPGSGTPTPNVEDSPDNMDVDDGDVHRTLKAFRQEWSKIKGTASYQTGLDILDALVAQPQLHLADFEVPFGDVVDTKGLNPDTLIWVDLNVSSDFRAVDLATRQITDIDSETWTSLQWRNTPDTPSADNRWITVLDLPATESGLGRIILKAPPGTTDFVTQPGRCEQHEWTCGTAMCPAGAITHAHWDYMGASTVCAHLSGRKLWCFWPYTPENSEFLLQCNEPGSANTIKCIRNLTGLRLMFFENKPTAFCVPPFTIHAVLTLTSATHFGGPTYEWKHAHEAVDRIEHSLKTSIPGLTAAYRLVLCEEIDACLGLWAECAASAKSPSITSAERTSFRQRCLELQRLARSGGQPTTKVLRVGAVPCPSCGEPAGTTEMPAHWIQYEGKDGANVLKERTQNRRALDGFVYPKNKNAPAQAWELVDILATLNTSEHWSTEIKVSFIAAQDFIGNLSSSRTRLQYIDSLRADYDIILCAIGTDIDYSDTPSPLPIGNLDGFICGLTDLEAAMPFFPRIGEMRHAGLKTEEERVLAEVARSVTKTARPSAHSWDGKSDIGGGFVAKRNRSDCARRFVKGPVDAKTLKDQDKNALGWLVQAYNPNLYTYGEARVLFINGVHVHTTASVPVNQVLETRPPDFLPLDVLRGSLTPEGIIPFDVCNNAGWASSMADRHRAHRELIEFADATLKAAVKVEQRSHTRSTTALERLARVDVSVWVDSDGHPHYYVNELERGMLVWLGLGSSHNIPHTRKALVDAFGELIMSLKRYHNL